MLKQVFSRPPIVFPLLPGHACPMLRHGSRLQLKAFEGYSTTFTGICLKQARIVAA